MRPCQNQVSNQTQANFDPTRYIGLWHEVARYDTLPYEKMCNSATALYTWDPETKMMGIRNTCYKDDNYVYASEGVARIPNMMESSKLKVHFTTQPSSPGEGDYWVLFTDYNNYAIVGGPSGQFLWVLSRRERMPAEDIPMIVHKIRSYGYDDNKLIAFRENIQY